jgi:hypothetical protein
MSERTVTAEAVRLSRAQQDAAYLASEAQRGARATQLARVEQRVHHAIRVLGGVMVSLWLIGLAVLIAMEVWF